MLILGFIGLLFGMFSIGVMQLILATAMPFIVEEIGGGALYDWVFSSYMLASIATIPLFAKFADIYGKRKFFILGMCFFALGSLCGGFAATMPYFIGARGIQGVGAGIISPVAMAMVSDMFPAEQRGKMIGLFGLVQLLSNLLSPPLGSFITKELGWSWIFFLNLGMIAFSMLLVLLGKTVQESKSDMKLKEIDILGGLLFGGFCLLAVTLANALSHQGRFGVLGAALLPALIFTGTMLVLNERKQKNPIIKMEFLKTQIIRRSLISAVLSGAIMYGLAALLPLCGVMLSRQGFPLDESKTLLFFMVSLTSGLLGGSRLNKLQLGQVPRYLWLILSVSSVFLLYSLYTVKIVPFCLFLILMGLCAGGIMATFLINSQNAVESEDRTVLSGLVQLGRYFGASIGVTLLIGMLPEVSLISGVGEFIGAFGLLVLLCLAGVLNEIL